MRTLLILALFSLRSPAETHFLHLSLNVTDPAAAIDFYTTRFDCERTGPAAIRAGSAQLLFRKVKTAPPSAIESAIWHFGWGAEDMPKAYQEQLAKGTEFDTPLTDISDLTRSPNFYYAYVRGPNGALIEINTASHHRFGHLHLLSADPVSAGLWWAKHFGVAWPPQGREPSKAARFYKGFQVAPSVSFTMDGINVIIFPTDKPLLTTRGRAVDHIGLRVDDLTATLKKLRAAGLRITSQRSRTAMIEGPDRLAIQLIKSPSLWKTTPNLWKSGARHQFSTGLDQTSPGNNSPQSPRSETATPAEYGVSSRLTSITGTRACPINPAAG